MSGRFFLVGLSVGMIVVLALSLGLLFGLTEQNPTTTAAKSKPVHIQVPENAQRLKSNVFHTVDEKAGVGAVYIVDFVSESKNGPTTNPQSDKRYQVPAHCFELLPFDAVGEYPWRIHRAPSTFYQDNLKLAASDWNAIIDPSFFLDPTFSSEEANIEQDGVNEIAFAAISSNGGSGILGVTMLYYDTNTRVLFEWDQVYNTEDFNLGDASEDSTAHDFLTVARHEHGHVAGLGDLSDDDCTGSIMYQSLGPGIRKDIDSVSAAAAAGDDPASPATSKSSFHDQWWSSALVLLVSFAFGNFGIWSQLTVLALSAVAL